MSFLWSQLLPEVFRKKINRSHSLQKIIGNTGWLLADNVIRIAVGFFVNAWVIRYLGPERFGIFSYVLAFLALFSPIAQLGLDAVVVRNIVREPDRRHEIIGSAFALKILAALATILLALSAIIILRPEDRLAQTLVCISILGTLLQPFTVIDFWFQSQTHAKLPVIARSIASLTIYAIKIALILTGGSLIAFAWTGVAELLLITVGLLIVYRAAGQRISSWRPSINTSTELLRDSWLFMLSDLIYFVYLRLDRIIIGELSGPAELGRYSVAVIAAEALFFIPQAVSLSIFPAVVEARATSLELFNEQLQSYYRLMAFLGYMAAVPLTLAANWLIPLIFGEAYAKAVPMLLVLVWGSIFLNLIHARSYYLTAMNWSRMHLIIDIIGCLINVALNLYLIPGYGGMGAAVASTATYFITAYLLCFAFKPLRETGVMMTRALLFPKFW